MTLLRTIFRVVQSVLNHLKCRTAVCANPGRLVMFNDVSISLPAKARSWRLSEIHQDSIFEFHENDEHAQ
jgi:hypothetical protein